MPLSYNRCHIFSTPGRMKQVFWTLAFIVSLVAVTYNIVTIVSIYLAYPVEIMVSLNQRQSTDFPSVTICNINPIRKSAWYELTATSGGGDVAKSSANATNDKHRARRSTIGKNKLTILRHYKSQKYLIHFY